MRIKHVLTRECINSVNVKRKKIPEMCGRVAESMSRHNIQTKPMSG